MNTIINSIRSKESRGLVIVFIYLFITLGTQGQDTLLINLETALELGGANNLTIQEYRQRQELAIANLSKAKEWWLPDVYAGVQTHQLWGAVMNGNGNFFLDVDRDNLWTGLGLDARWNFADGIYQTKSANLKVQAAHYQTHAEHNKALLEIVVAYYDFMATQLYYQAFQQLAAQADTISRQVAIQVAAGLAYQSELLLSKSNVNHLMVQMLNAKIEYGQNSATLVKLLNLDPTLKLLSVDSVMIPLDLFKYSETIAFDSVYQNRPEFKQSESSLQSIEMERKTVTTGLLIPELRLNTYSSYFGGLGGQVTPMDPVLYPETNQLYTTGAFNVSLMWQIPIGRLIYGGDVKRYNAQILIQQTQLEQVKAEINEEITTARQLILAAKEQMEIAFDGNQFAELALQQSIQRQQLGTVRPFEILQAQEIFIKARLDYLKAVADFNKAQYALMAANGESL